MLNIERMLASTNPQISLVLTYSQLMKYQVRQFEMMRHFIALGEAVGY